VEIGGKTNICACLTSAILLDHRSVDSARSMVGIGSTTNEQFPLWNSTKVLNIVLVRTLQSSMIVDLLQNES
jgi:hypothetical protein